MSLSSLCKIVVSVNILLCFCLFSCEGKKKAEIKYFYDTETVPTIRTQNDTMYVTDSGRVRFKIMARTMLLFDKAKEPFTLFPDSAYMEQYDSLMNVITTGRADSVWSYDRKKLWKMRGNVEIVNNEGATFNSQELYWNQQEDKIYSDQYVVIKEPYKATMKAYGFVSNQNMTEYTYRRAENADFYIYDNGSETQKNDPIK